MIDKLEAIVDRFYQLEESLGDPEVISDMGQFKLISKQYKDLKTIVEKFNAYKDVIGNIETA